MLQSMVMAADGGMRQNGQTSSALFIRLGWQVPRPAFSKREGSARQIRRHRDGGRAHACPGILHPRRHGCGPHGEVALPNLQVRMADPRA